MIKNKLNLINDDLTWNPARRYKINTVVAYLDINYQNTTGRNSLPTLGVDWQVSNTSSGTYYEEFVYASGAQVFTLPLGTKVLSVHLNNAFLKKTLWSVVANLLTVTEPLVAFDEIIVTGIN